MALEKHLSYPLTSFLSFFNELIKMSEVLKSSELQNGKSLVKDEDFLMGDSLDGAVMEDDSEIPVIKEEQWSDGSYIPPKPYDNRFFTKNYPTGVESFGQGDTFMDLFDADDHADKR
jgi:hypothetical protein